MAVFTIAATWTKPEPDKSWSRHHKLFFQNNILPSTTRSSRRSLSSSSSPNPYICFPFPKHTPLISFMPHLNNIYIYIYIYIYKTNKCTWENIFLIHITSHQHFSVYSRPSSGCVKDTNKIYNKLLNCAGKTSWNNH